MSWTENKILLEYTKYTPCQDIFQAVCDEIGKHYEKRGDMKYARSRPKITYKDKDIQLDICFWSSRSNTPGDCVCLEILPNFYSAQLKKKGMGLLFGHTGLFKQKHTGNPGQTKVVQIFGDEIERIDENNTESAIIYNNSCNVYGLDEHKFNSIIKFIDDEIIVWIEKLKTEAGIVALTSNMSLTRKVSLKGEGTNSSFREYVKTCFPDIDIDKQFKD
jgi:hypothetical protein